MGSTWFFSVTLVGLLLTMTHSEASGMTPQTKPARDARAATGRPDEVRGRPFNLAAKPEAITLDPAKTDGRESRILIRDTWNTDIVAALKPEAGDDVVYKTRFSGFFKTDLDARLKKLGVTHLIITGCTTSICVDSTVREAMFRDYLPVLLADCMSEPIGHGLPRGNRRPSCARYPRGCCSI